MNVPELTGLMEAAAPAIAALISLAHPAAAVLRRRKREHQLRELIRGELRPILERVEALEKRWKTATPAPRARRSGS